MPNPRLTSELITAAIDGYEAQKSRLDAKIAELRQLLDGRRTATTAATPEPAKPKRRLSVAARKRIAAAQRKRWAAVKAAKAQQEKAAKKSTKKTAGKAA